MVKPSQRIKTGRKKGGLKKGNVFFRFLWGLKKAMRHVVVFMKWGLKKAMRYVVVLQNGALKKSNGSFGFL